ncbi:Tssk2, partial [Symbiodinium sp. KB8]
DRVAAQQARLSEGYGGDDTLLEKALMYNLSSHPHVARIVECWHEARNIYTVMEYVNGELLSRVSAGGAFDEATARHFFRQILAGVKALHDIGYCHRDLSLENVLVTDDDVAKLIDFGAAARLPPLSRVTAPDGSTSWVDTPLQPPATPFGKTAYMLPEYYHKLPYSGRQFDLWSAAVCLYIMLEGEYLYAAPSAADAKFMALHTGNFAGLFEARNTARAAAGRPPLSPALQDLLAGTLHPDPNARPHTVDVLLGHVWVSGSTPPPPPLSST